jgi:hypothetical protein
MSISKTTKLIGGRTIELHRCAVTEGLDLQLSLLKSVGKVDLAPLMAAAAGDAGKAIALGLNEAVANVARNLSVAELTRLMEMVFKYITIDGHPFHDINADFSDRPLDVWQAFIAAAEHNLGPLVGELRRKFVVR